MQYVIFQAGVARIRFDRIHRIRIHFNLAFVNRCNFIVVRLMQAHEVNVNQSITNPNRLDRLINSNHMISREKSVSGVSITLEV